MRPQSTQPSTLRITDQRGDRSVLAASPSIQYLYSSSTVPPDFSTVSQASRAANSASLPRATA